jgi:enamine deaminase RidA (YjgF/YER057c/UK114 family)
MEFTLRQEGNRKEIGTGRVWEEKVGYSRAVQIGNNIAVTGCLGLNDDGSVPAGAGNQTKLAMELILSVLQELGAGKKDIIRTRIYVTNMDQWEEIGQAHGAFFGQYRPATTMVEISRLALEGCFVEIEADAVLSD